MALLSVSNVAIKGLAATVPKRKASNWDYDLISEKERKLLIKTTGVETRRIVEEGVCTSDLCERAAQELLDELHWERGDIDVLIFVSQTPDYHLPATAIILQNKLGLSKRCMAFDINLGCSGYVYGLSVIGQLMSSGQLKKGLLLVGDTSSASIAKQDKTTYPLFGDAGTATALVYDKGAPDMHFNLQSDGKEFDAIIIREGMTRLNTVSSLSNPALLKEEKKRSTYQLELNGHTIFNFALREVAPNLKELLANQQSSIDTYDYFIFHQANLLMNESIRRKMKLPKEKVPMSIREFGNTSSASIPLTMITEMREALMTQSCALLLCGFGVGLSWGSATLTTDKLCCPKLIEI